MDKSVIEQFKSNLEAAEIEGFQLRIEGGNRTIYHNKDSKIYLQGDYMIGIETKNNHGAKTKNNFNIIAVPYDNVDNAKAFEVTVKQLIAFLQAEGIPMDEELDEFIKTHGGRVSIDLKSSGYYGEIHNEKGQVVLPSPMPGRVTLAVTSDEEGKVEIDPESPIV